MDAQQQFKQAAAESAVALVEDGMILGLGTGSTAKLAVDALGKRVAGGLRVTGIPTSEATGAQARSLGIPVSTLDEHPEIDLTIDGADEVERGSAQPDQRPRRRASAREDRSQRKQAAGHHRG